MEKRYNLVSFYLILFCSGLALYSLYSTLSHIWMIVPPNYILIVFSLLALILGIKGFKDKRNWRTKVRSWLTLILSLLLSIVLFLGILINLYGVKHIKSVHSPDGHYTIDLYRYNGGAGGPFGIKAELNGPLWFRKPIYYRHTEERAEVVWLNNSTVSINNHTLNLKEGDTFGY